MITLEEHKGFFSSNIQVVFLNENIEVNGLYATKNVERAGICPDGAVGARFELAMTLPSCRFSKPVHSTALPPHHLIGIRNQRPVKRVCRV